MKRLILGLMLCSTLIACVSGNRVASQSGTETSSRVPNSIPQDACYSESNARVVPEDLVLLAFNLNPGELRDAPEMKWEQQVLQFETFESDLCNLAKIVATRQAKPKPGLSNIAMINITHGARSKTYLQCHATRLGVDLRCDTSRTGKSENCFVYGLLQNSACK